MLWRYVRDNYGGVPRKPFAEIRKEMDAYLDKRRLYKLRNIK